MEQNDLSALLCSRICHDLISPVGAIGNGVELLNELHDGASDELDLIGQSAATASATLQFFRLAFGAARPGDAYALHKCHDIIAGNFKRERSELRWPSQRGDITRASARLMCNLMMIAASALPRSGVVTVNTEFIGDFLRVDISAEGPVVVLQREAELWLEGSVTAEKPSPKDVHFLIAHKNLKASGAALKLRRDEHCLSMKADIPLTV